MIQPIPYRYPRAMNNLWILLELWIIFEFYLHPFGERIHQWLSHWQLNLKQQKHECLFHCIEGGRALQWWENMLFNTVDNLIFCLTWNSIGNEVLTRMNNAFKLILNVPSSELCTLLNNEFNTKLYKKISKLLSGK